MGLCKCPKRKVTNQFCFEHRVNVCEHCMVANHPKCIVQSYLQWLKDSDYNPICELCQRELVLEDCIRLICYHVYHWVCLDNYARRLPDNTAPAGYTCPCCKTELFPASNVVSPIADCLREMLGQVNWAREGLGLPLLDEERPNPEGSVPEVSSVSNEKSQFTVTHHSNMSQPSPEQQTRLQAFSSQPLVNSSQSTAAKPAKVAHMQGTETYPPLVANTPEGPHSVVQVDGSRNPFKRQESFGTGHLGQPIHRIFDAMDEGKGSTFDHDENKYKRRSAMEWFSRWWRTISRPPSQTRRSPWNIYKRYAMVAVLVVIGLLTLVAVLHWIGRSSTQNDPMLDPMMNPNIRVKENEA